MMHRRAFLVGVGAAIAGATTARAAADDALPHALLPCTPSFLRTAPHVIRATAVLPASPQRVFDTLAAPAPWPLWLTLVEHVEYRTPFGPGAIRDVTTGAGVIREHFLAWEPGERFMFHVLSSTSSMLSRFMEDYVLRPVQGGRTRLQWTVALEMNGLAALAGPAAAAVFEVAMPAGLARLAALLDGRGNVEG